MSEWNDWCEMHEGKNRRLTMPNDKSDEPTQFTDTEKARCYDSLREQVNELGFATIGEALASRPHDVTEAMLEAAEYAWDEDSKATLREDFARLYLAMLAASPTANQE